ncbi:MAG: hypothetical protein ACI86S_001730 [Paracoccaceae bacterium]|jgi:hypothetical protein
MFLDEKEHWAEELRTRSANAKQALDSLGKEDLVVIGDTLLIGAFIGRRLLEEGLQSEQHVRDGKKHFASDSVLRLSDLAKRQIHLGGCWKIDLRSDEPILDLNSNETLTLVSLLNQIIHLGSIQLWKSPSRENPCFWVGSPEHTNSKKTARFHRVYWSSFSDWLGEIASATVPSVSSRT